MFHINFLLTCMFLSSFSSAQNLRGLQTQTVDLLTAFHEMRSGFVWPTPSSDPSLISSTFGPRIKSSTSGYDFHRGVDIHGDIGEPVVASYGGLVKTVGTYYSGGKYITLEHTFNTPVTFHDQTITKWYTMYLHLNAQNVAVGDIVAANQTIGELGNSGADTVTPHLHHEVRVGTRCSLEYAVENPSSTCNRLGFDPATHALFLYPHADTTSAIPTLSLTQELSATQDAIVSLETPDTDANVNRYDIKVIDTTTGSVVKAHTLDLNLRIGFIATSTAALDTPDTNFPYLDPIGMGYTTSTWNINLVIPTVWLPSKSANEKIEVTVTTIWDGSVTTSFGQNISW